MFSGRTDCEACYSKGTRIEVYTLTVDGLKPTIEFSIHGTIIALRLYTPQVSVFILCLLDHCT